MPAVSSQGKRKEPTPNEPDEDRKPEHIHVPNVSTTNHTQLSDITIQY